MNISALPMIIITPVMPLSASTMKQVAVIQCTNRSNALNRTMVRPERPDSILTMPRTR